MQEALEAGVRALVRDRGLGAGREVERLEGGLVNQVFRVDHELVVRVGSGATASADFARAASVMRAIEGKVPAPHLLYFDQTRDHLPWDVMVCSAVEGERLSTLWPGLGASERGRLGAQVGDALEALHATPVEAVPEFDALPAWPERKAASVRDSLLRAERAQAFPETHLARMRRFYEHNLHALDQAPPPVIIHYDVHWENVIVRDGAVVALLDFDDVRLAPAEQDWWELLFATHVLDDPDTDVAWFANARGCELSAPGCLERFLMDEIDEIVKLLTEDLGWIDRESARRDAHDAFHRAFEGAFFSELLARVSS